MTAAPHGLVVGIDVLQRALDYTCDALTTVTGDDVDGPTPCSDWTLADLLAHMEDAIDAFAEAADGRVALRSTPTTHLDDRVRTIRRKASALLGAWLAADAGRVDIGEGVGAGTAPTLPIDAITRIAALEIAVHGWDVRQATGHGRPLPEPLATALLPSALQVALHPDERFAPPVPVALDAPAGAHVLALLGRR